VALSALLSGIAESGAALGAASVAGAGPGAGAAFSAGADGDAGFGVVASCAKAGNAISAATEAAVKIFFMTVTSFVVYRTLPGQSVCDQPAARMGNWLGKRTSNDAVPARLSVETNERQRIPGIHREPFATSFRSTGCGIRDVAPS
jgi:hypothetical protein